MSRDYKQSTQKQTGQKGGNPVIIGVLIGLLAGIGISIGVALYISKMPSPFSQTPQVASPGAVPTNQKLVPPAKAVPESKPPDKPRFDFYKILPGVEEPVAEQDVQQAGLEQTNAAYFLQAGSFQNETDADNLKAKLAILGMEAHIQTANLPDKGVWHRVRVGPLMSIQEIDQTRSILEQNDVKTTLIKMKK